MIPKSRRPYHATEKTTTFGELGLVECRRSLDHHQLAVVLEPLSSAVNQRQRIAERVKVQQMILALGKTKKSSDKRRAIGSHLYPQDL